MDGSSEKKAASFEPVVIQNIANVNALKAKLREIIGAGKEYEYDVSTCVKELLQNNDDEVVLLSVQAISELAKCEKRREIYATTELICSVLHLMRKDVTPDTIGLLTQCCRAIGNLCCDNNISRTVLFEYDGVAPIVNIFSDTISNKPCPSEELKLLSCKTLLNYAIGGQQFADSLVEVGLLDLIHEMLIMELDKDDMNDNLVSTALLIMSVMSDNTPERIYPEEINIAVLNVLRETANIEISELCLDHLHTQAESDKVKKLLANEKGVQAVCSRLEFLVKQHEAGKLTSEDSEVEMVLKQACDLIIIVLTGDEAMHSLYDNGSGEVYSTMVRWLKSTNFNLLTTAILAIGNFARQDDYCVKMMEDKIFDKLLDIFELYHGHFLKLKNNPEEQLLVDSATITKVQHAVLSALRNLIVPPANKKVAAVKGRAAPLFLGALPSVEDHHVAYKLLAAIRMLVDGQEEVATQFASDRLALTAVARWGHSGQHAGAAGEAPRLLAWASRQLGGRHCRHMLQVEGCLSTLVNMLVVCHSVMQNEAILALTLLALKSLEPSTPPDDSGFDYETSFINQMLKSEIGKHLSVLIETNCAKMPPEVAENLLAFLTITTKKNRLAFNYKHTRVHESLQKFLESRKDMSDNLKSCIPIVIQTIADAKLD